MYSKRESLFEMKILRIVSRIIIGMVFVFSGVVKAIDPLGTAYKFHDYFQAFNIGFLNNLSLPLAILLFTAEFIAGFLYINRIKLKTGHLGRYNSHGDFHTNYIYSCINQSCFRLRVLWRCYSSDQLADIRKKYCT